MNDIKKMIADPGQLWAITEAGLNSIIEIQGTEINPELMGLLTKRGERADFNAGYEVRGDVAILSVIGPILRYEGGFFSWLMNATSTEQMAIDFQKTIDDPMIRAVILNIDSPGGVVVGINEFSEIIYKARGQKPIVAYVGGMGGSAAYWIASAADRIVVNETAEVGSIGVIKLYRKTDSETYEFINTASPKKRVDPASDAGRAEIVKQIDDVFDVMLQNIAKNRGVNAETVKSDFGQGGVLIGKFSVEAGLADELGDLETLIRDLQANINLTRGRLVMAETQSRETLEANFAIIKEQAGDLISAIETEAKKTGYDEGHKKGIAEGLKAERERVASIMGVEDADPEAQKKAIAEGMAAEAAYRLFFEAEKSSKKTAIDDMKKGAGDETAGAGGKEKGAGGDDTTEAKAALFTSKVNEYKTAKNCSHGDAMSAINLEFPELRVAWLEQRQKGK